MQVVTHKIEQFEKYVVKDKKRFDLFLFLSFVGFVAMFTGYIILVLQILN